MRATLVFDGQCGFCTRCAGWLHRLDRRKQVRLRPFQGHGVLTECGLTAAQAAASVSWIDNDTGRQASGAEAVNLALAAALGTRAPLVLYRFTRPVQERLYRLVARNRHRLPGVRPYCETHPTECTP